MAAVVIYSNRADPYSIRAKRFLESKGVDYEERDAVQNKDRMFKETGSTVPPQILINNVHIGSYEQLGSLELQGKLDELLDQE